MSLTWALLILSIVIAVVVGLLVLAGALRRRSGVAADAIVTVAVSRGGNGLPWLTVGMGITGVLLVGILVWTVIVLAAVNSQPQPRPDH